MDEELKDDEGTEPEEQGKQEPQGGPDDAKAADKYKAQRDEARQQLRDLQEQVKALEADKDKVSQLQSQIEQMQRDAEEAAKKAESDRVNSNRLVKAGCVDVEVALGLLDENGDVDKLKESKPYLFGAPKGSTGLPPAPSDDDKDEDALLDKAMGIRR